VSRNAGSKDVDEEKNGHWAVTKAVALIQEHIGPDQKISDIRQFHTALIQALQEAHDEGLAAGLRLRKP
jgi:hypothetical protein